MAAADASQLVENYVSRLDRALTGMPADRRREIVEEIRRHIADERSGVQNESAADVMNLLDRLGDPSEIAAEARAGLPEHAEPRAVRLGTLEVLALALTIVAWPAGIVLLWVSKAWSPREKVLGSLIPPGGYPGVFLVMSTFRYFVAMADAAPKGIQVAVGAVLFTLSLLLVLAPIGMCVYLATRPRARASALRDR